MCNQRRLCNDENCERCFNNSFASHEKSIHWHDENDKTPREVFKKCNTKYYFNCDKCPHIFHTSPSHIAGEDRWCPYCASQKLCDKKECKVCFDKSFASQSKSQFWSNKNDKNPREVLKRSIGKFWFDCNHCSHEFLSSLDNIKNRWCPYCSNPPKRLCDDESCENCFNKSFASHEKSIFWSNENDKTPREVFKNANKKFYFNCMDCNHSFETTLNSISTNSSWCSYCFLKNLCEEEECKDCFNKSFASQEKSQYWSEENDKTPREVFRCSGEKYWFDCENCGHSFDTTLGHINTGNWCPYCSNPPKRLCEKEECKDCFDKSFASNEKSIFWSSKNVKKPREVFKCSGEKFWFDCEDCNHSFEIRLADIVSKNQWCNRCRYKTEKILYHWLVSMNFTLENNRLEWARNPETNRFLPFDFVISIGNTKIIIELDGPQHFVQISNWGNVENNQARDIYKMNLAKENGYRMIRILQEDVFFNRYDWKLELFQAIIKKDLQIFLCKNNEYDVYQNKNER